MQLIKLHMLNERWHSIKGFIVSVHCARYMYCNALFCQNTPLLAGQSSLFTGKAVLPWWQGSDREWLVALLKNVIHFIVIYYVGGNFLFITSVMKKNLLSKMTEWLWKHLTLFEGDPDPDEKSGHTNFRWLRCFTNVVGRWFVVGARWTSDLNKFSG